MDMKELADQGATAVKRSTDFLHRRELEVRPVKEVVLSIHCRNRIVPRDKVEAAAAQSTDFHHMRESSDLMEVVAA